jgi:2-isopropylmalate synthase
MHKRRTLINDATLREGNQASGVKFTVDDSVAIATALDGVGVDMIEIGHPLAGPDEHQRTEAVAKLGLRAEIIAHARAHRTDIEAVARTGATWVGIFLGVNDITTKARVIGRSIAELIRMVADAVKVAKDCDLNIRTPRSTA